MFLFPEKKDFGDNLVVPGQVIPEQVSARRFHKQDRAKNSEVQSNFGYAPDVGFVAQQVTTENSSTSEVSVDFPQASFAHMSFPIYSKFSQDDYYFLGTYNNIFSSVHIVNRSKKKIMRSKRKEKIIKKYIKIVRTTSMIIKPLRS